MLRQHGCDCHDQWHERREALEAEGVELLMTGGHLRRQSQSFYGDRAEQSLQNYHFDLLFWALTPSILIAV